jgi:hypothetical protein
MTKVAAQFKVSGSYMARVCVLLNIPRPERGYWAKLAVDKAPPQKPLPDARPGDTVYWSKDGTYQPLPKPQLPQGRPEGEARIPRNRTHSLIRGSKEQFENSRPVDDGAYLRPYKKLLMDVTASKACLDKALDFANDLFNAFESVGHRVIIAPSNKQMRRAAIDEREVADKQRRYNHYSALWSPYRPTVVYVGSVAIGLAIVEMSEEVLLRYVGGKYIRDADYFPPKPSRYHVDHSWTTTKDIPSGRLRLVAYSPYWRVDWSANWQETKTTSLRSAIKSIVKFVEGAVGELVCKLEEANRQAEIAQQEWIAAQEKRRRDEELLRIEQSRRESQEHLAQIIQQWSNVTTIERFLAGVEQEIAKLPEAEKPPVLERLRLAREFLGNQNPFDFFRSWKAPEERYRPIYLEPR